MSGVSYSAVGPVTKRVTKPVSRPGKAPKPKGGVKAPTNFTATAASSSQINLSWTASTTPNITGYSIERSADGVTGWAEVLTPDYDQISIENTGLTAETEYFYRIRAVKGSKVSAWSNVDSDTTEPLSSAFEDAVMALSPRAAYLFRDADFSSQISDSSGNGHHLIKQIATAARAASWRPSHPGGASFVNPANFAVNGTLYRQAAGGLDAIVGGATSISIVIGWKVSSGTYGQGVFPFTVGTEGAGDSGTNHLVSILSLGGSSLNIQFKGRSPVGINSASDTTLAANTPMIHTHRQHFTTTPGRILDRRTASGDTQVNRQDPTLGGGGVQDVSRTTFIGGRNGAGTTGLRPFVIDHLSVFVPALSEAQLDSLRTAYAAEII